MGWLDQVAMWKVNQSWCLHGIAGLAPRLGGRARVQLYRAHPGELRHLRSREGLVRSGVSAAGELGLDLVSPDELDIYVREDRVEQLMDDHALVPVARNETNVILRAVALSAWHLEDHEVAPSAKVALDLAADPDPRSARIGIEMLQRIDAARPLSR